MADHSQRAVGLFCFMYLTHWMRDALYGPSGRSWFRAALVGGASSLLTPGVTFGVCLLLTGEPWSSLIDLLQPDKTGFPLLLWTMLLTWAPVAVFACASDRELRYRRDWDGQQIS